MQKMIDIVTEQGVVKTIGLSVLTENQSAIKLYEKLGFQKYGTEPKALYDGKRYYDEDLMVLFV
nr:GNAT family protein [Staphylococcus ureilyticus]